MSPRRSWYLTGSLFLAISSMVLLTFCSSKSIEPEWQVPDDAIVFDVFHINYAWGFDCGGYYVDGSGAVHHYDCRELEDTVRADYQHASEILERRYGMDDTVTCNIDSDALSWAFGLVEDAGELPPLEEHRTGYDMGGTSYTAFIYDPSTEDGTEVPLATSGDVSQDPSTDAAAQLVAWLKTLPACE